MFITFEGIEGCGKSTQIRLLKEQLIRSGKEVLLTREPGGSPIADQIRSVLLDAENRAMVPMAELLLYAAARAQHVEEIIRPALASGRVVLCDRFADATRAYQSFGRGIDRQTVEELNSLACGGIRPDLTVLLDCDVMVGLGRAKSRIETTSGPREERFEQEALEFHQKVRNGYLALAGSEPDRFVVVDASLDVDQVSRLITTAVLDRLAGKP
jgi:dTMP kinase